HFVRMQGLHEKYACPVAAGIDGTIEAGNGDKGLTGKFIRHDFLLASSFPEFMDRCLKVGAWSRGHRTADVAVMDGKHEILRDPRDVLDADIVQSGKHMLDHGLRHVAVLLMRTIDFLRLATKHKTGSVTPKERFAQECATARRVTDRDRHCS